MTSEKAKLFPLLPGKWNKNKLDNMIGAIYGVVEGAEKAEALGYRPGSALKQLGSIGKCS